MFASVVKLQSFVYIYIWIQMSLMFHDSAYLKTKSKVALG